MVQPGSLHNWEECPLLSHPLILLLELHSQRGELPSSLGLVSKPMRCAGFYFQFPVCVFSALVFGYVIFNAFSELLMTSGWGIHHQGLGWS